MNKEIIDIVKAKIEDTSFICKHSLILSFAITIVVLILRNGFTFKNMTDIIFPAVIFIVIYLVMNTLAYCTTSSHIITKLYNGVLNVRQSYNDLINDELFESVKNMDVLKKKIKKTKVKVQQLEKKKKIIKKKKKNLV